MTQAIKAIETRYKGFLFRSRLEARWAVFMDAMGVPYEYEREGYNLDGLFYLPDFWLPQMQAHLEIKPDKATEEEWAKATALARHSDLTVYVLCGQPTAPHLDTNWYPAGSHSTAVFPPFIDEDGNTAESADFHYIWCECPHCGRCELQFDGRADRIKCECPRSWHGDKGYNFDSPRLLAAYTKARSARFEGAK